MGSQKVPPAGHPAASSTRATNTTLNYAEAVKRHSELGDFLAEHCKTGCHAVGPVNEKGTWYTDVTVVDEEDLKTVPAGFNGIKIRKSVGPPVELLKT